MNRKLIQLLGGLLTACLMVTMILGTVMTSFAAASARISFSDPTVTVGEEVSVTFKFATTDGSVLGNTDTMLSYDASTLEYINETENASGGAGSIRVWSAPEGKAEMVTVLRFKALQAGTAQITVTTWEAYDNDGQMLNLEREGSSTVTVSPLATSSTDATLQSLQISPGALSPSFTPMTDSYRVTVGLDTDKLAVSANPNNSGAKVVLTGGDELAEGENTVICQVTAEDGVTTKDYTIIVNKILGGETAAAGGDTDPTEAAEEILATLDVTAKSVQILAPGADVEIPEGFKESSISVGQIKVQGWVWAADETPRYCVFYGMNEDGEKGFYRYDLAEKTIQRYFEDPLTNDQNTEALLKETAEKYNSLLRDYRIGQYILIAVSVIAVLLLILHIVFAMNRKNVTESRSRREEPEEELTTYVPVVQSSRKKLTKEERYMLGEEDTFEDFEELNIVDHDQETYEAEAAASLDDVEKALESKLAEAAAQNDDDDEDDDFEIFDL